MEKQLSNERAKRNWGTRAVGSRKSQAVKGTVKYFEDIRAHRYGYETPFLPRVMKLRENDGKSVLEIGVGNGTDAVEMVRSGANYTGLDITPNHLELTRQNFGHHLPDYHPKLIEGDLLDVPITQKYDVVYAFGVLHHIAHEAEYLQKIRDILHDDGELRIGVYSKYSFFNIYLVVMWIVKNRARMPLDDWRSHKSERTEPGSPVVHKIRSRREVIRLLADCGFDVVEYHKRGFVQRYIPIIGRYFKPDGMVLNFLGSLLGWYHLCICRKSNAVCQKTNVRTPQDPRIEGQGIASEPRETRMAG